MVVIDLFESALIFTTSKGDQPGELYGEPEQLIALCQGGIELFVKLLKSKTKEQSSPFNI